jgi:hypothetical protein
MGVFEFFEGAGVSWRHRVTAQTGAETYGIILEGYEMKRHTTSPNNIEI